MGSLLLLIVIGISLPSCPTIVDEFDLVEVNHYVGDQDKIVFDQLILWDWSRLDRRFNAHYWTMMHDGWDDQRMPRRDYKKDRWVIQYVDHDIERVIYCKWFRESWTRVDPERENRILFQEMWRRGLSTIREEEE